MKLYLSSSQEGPGSYRQRDCHIQPYFARPTETHSMGLKWQNHTSSPRRIARPPLPLDKYREYVREVESPSWLTRSIKLVSCVCLAPPVICTVSPIMRVTV